MIAAVPYTTAHTPLEAARDIADFTALERYLLVTNRARVRTPGLTVFRKVAYIRVFSNDTLTQVHFTEYGRKLGIRNWQAARDAADLDSVEITGWVPDPRSYPWKCNRTIYLLQGEGEPFSITGPWKNECLCSATLESGTRDVWRVQRIGDTYEVIHGKTQPEIITYMKGISK